jgi:hypothetical protein
MLEQMNQRLKGCRTVEAAIEAVLRDVVALHGAELGNLQLRIADRLLLVAERGVEAPFLHAFREIGRDEYCASARAWKTGESVIIEGMKA